MPVYRRRVDDPPSSITGPTRVWLQQVVDAINGMPRVSVFSGVSPNSVVTGMPGDVLVNLGSASTDSRVWVKGGGGVTVSNTGWVVVRIA